MSAQARAITVALSAARNHAGEVVTYCRVATELEFNAIKGRRLPELVEQAGTRSSPYTQTQAELTDWLFPVSALADLTPAEPAIGDWIEWDGVKYPLTAAEDGKCWRWVDPAQTWVRVHTVKGADA